MSKTTLFYLDDQKVQAHPGETILDCALRVGRHIPHQCSRTNKELSSPGRCRNCLVEVVGEPVLKASCREEPREGMRVFTASPRVLRVRAALNELRESAPRPMEKDTTHPAIALDRSLCIQCGQCVAACRDIQCQDVLGLAGRGVGTRVVFDLDLAMGLSDCVSCGQCVQACPTGALRSTAYDPVPEDDDQEIRSERTLCPFCSVGCHLQVRTRGNRIVDVTAGNGPTNKGRLCVKGRFGLDFVLHSDRLTTPLVRLPGVDKGTPVSDWRKAFRPVAWDEALDAAAAGLMRASEEYGPDALAFWGSLKTCNEDNYLFQKLARCVFRTNNVDHPTRLCHASSTAALLEGVGIGAPSSRISECGNADLIFVIGSNPSASHPVAGSFIRNAARSGAKLIVADVREQPLDRFATRVLRLRPGSNVVLLNAMINVIVEEGLYDHAFVESRVDGFEAVAERCRDFPPSWAAEVCGVKESVLRDTARAFAAAKAAMTIWGMGMTQHSQGTDYVRSLISLILICGHVGRPGTGLFPIRGHNNAQGAPDAGMLPGYLPDYQPVTSAEVRAFFARLWGQEPPSTPGLSMLETVDAVHAGDVTAMYVMGANPAMCMPNLERVHAALAKLDHLVVQDIFMTETAAFADVVLPAAALLEKTGTLTNVDRRVQLTCAVLDPPGQARADWRIVQDMARRCGTDWGYDKPADIYEEFRRAQPSITGITLDRLEEGVQYPCVEKGAAGTPFLFAERFNTSTGRARLVPAGEWRPPVETSKEYPFILTTGRILEHHTGPMSRRARVLNNLVPQAFVQMSKTDMERLGIISGQRVRVRSVHGSVETTARMDPGLPGGLVFSPFCFEEAAANMLTGPAMDPVSLTGEMKYTAVAVSPCGASPGRDKPHGSPCPRSVGQG